MHALSVLLYEGTADGDLDTSMFDIVEWGTLGALWYARQGEVDRALERLQASYVAKALFQNTVTEGPLMCAPMAYPEALLTHPRYHAFWAQPGLAELAAVLRANGRTQSLPQ